MRLLAKRYRRWLGSRLRLTAAGRIVFTVVLALGVAGVAGDDLTGGTTGPNAAAILGIFVFLALMVVVAANAVLSVVWAGAQQRWRSRVG